MAAFYADLAAGELDAACGWWTDDYTAASVEEWNEGGYGQQVANCPELLQNIVDTLAIVGDPAEQLAVTDLRSTAAGPAEARVVVTLAAADEPETYLLTRTDDGWRINGHETGDLGPGQR